MKLRVTSTDEEQKIYGHGKLLITGEYFVLDGTEALAVPTGVGQSLRIKELQSGNNTLYWVALNNKKQVWLNLVFDISSLQCINSKSDEALMLSKILTTARQMNHAFLTGKNDIAVETYLEFPNEWGLGSSSTLIYCVSKWANINGYDLLQQTMGGSGYDVVCAGSDTAVLYRLENGRPQSSNPDWTPPYQKNIYFAYTGVKKVSSEAIKYYRTQLKDKSDVVKALSDITTSILTSNTLQEFEALINEHEAIVGSNLKLPKIKDTMFADYWGSVKSLGAWGGDFVLLTNDRGEDELKKYLVTKNIAVVFSWENLILNFK